MLVGGVIALLVYVWALFFTGPLGWQIAISVLALIAVGAVCAVIIWVGYTLATTPAPATLEIESEISKETETQQQEKTINS